MASDEYASVHSWLRARDPVVKHLYRLRTNAVQGGEDVQVRLMSTTYTLLGSAVFLMSWALFAGYIFWAQHTLSPNINDISIESLDAAHVLPDMAVTLNMVPCMLNSELSPTLPCALVV